jgi:GNAT superfamily N-acetyltransferase
MPTLKLERVHGPARRAIIKELMAYNTRAVGNWGFKGISITLRHRGAIVGGLAADTYLGWMYVRLLWVSEDYRGQEFGSKLMKAAEKEARRRGIKQAWVDTFSFQAPAFYRKLGYRQFGRLKDYPAGHFRSFLTKAL